MQITRAQSVEVNGARVAIRNPVALWILTFMTLGIFGIVWWWQLNRELRDMSRALERPLNTLPVVTTVLVAIWPLAWIPGMIATYVGARHVRTMQEGVATPGRIKPIVAALLFPLLFAQVIYVQRAANAVWQRLASGVRPEPDWAVATGAAEAVASGAREEARRDASRWR
jgi:hypothetical protein